MGSGGEGLEGGKLRGIGGVDGISVLEYVGRVSIVGRVSWSCVLVFRLLVWIWMFFKNDLL